MNDKYIKKSSEDEDKKSNCSVLNLSLESTKEISKESISRQSIVDLKKELMDEVNLPIENESEKELEFDLENNSQKNFSVFGKKLKTRKKSQSFHEKHNIKKNKIPILKEPTEYISPLKLSRKTFGFIPSWNKKPNEVLCDFQKNIIDCKSCNDDDSQCDFFLLYSETERSTPNQEDLQNLLNCRKKMTLFKNGINNKSYKEYENILNSDNLFVNKKINSHKKNNFWHRHIRQMLRENSNKACNSFLTRLSTGAIADKSSNNEKNKEGGLFILGILESAVNQRKGRYTTNI
jgi:hypothetical protein